MKQFLLVVAWVAMGMLASQRATADDNGANIPHPKLSRSIDLSDVGTHAGVKSLCFSPDSRYLAVADGSLGQTMIIVWDLQLDREQSRIVALPRSIGGDPQIEPLWSPDGRSITLGTGSPIKFWNPLTGEEVRQLSIDEPVSWSRYNRDGSKLLVNRTGILGPMAGPKGGFRVYDTRTWQFDDFSNDGLSVFG
jgi:WD40 repeat protein